jgi:putative endonuclease
VLLETCCTGSTQHRIGQVPGFTRRYHVNRLVFYEETPSARSAFERERKMKGWKRQKKIRLIETVNPEWVDLAKEWFPTGKLSG